jgi:hypothetical protein
MKGDIQVSSQGKVVHFKVEDAQGRWVEVTFDADAAEEAGRALVAVAKAARRNR